METPLLSPDSPELQEILTSSNLRVVEQNSYKRRSQPIPILVNNKEESWFSLKGGVSPEKSEEAKRSANFEVLYNPATNQWLKIVPPEINGHVVFTERLKTAVEILRASLKLSGIEELIPQIVEYPNLIVRDRETYGFLSPHFGPTLEFIISELRGQYERGNFPPQALGFLSLVYQISFNHAVDLYLDYEYWTADPNPGNILLVPNSDGYFRVVNTDFANKKQVRRHRGIEELPLQYIDSIKRSRRLSRIRHINELYSHYQKFRKKYGLTLLDQPGELDEYIAEQLAARPELG